MGKAADADAMLCLIPRPSGLLPLDVTLPNKGSSKLFGMISG